MLLHCVKINNIFHFFLGVIHCEYDWWVLSIYKQRVCAHTLLKICVKITLTSDPVVWAIEKGEKNNIPSRSGPFVCVAQTCSTFYWWKPVPTFIKKEHTQGREREKKKKRTKIKVQASKQPQKRQTTRRKVNHWVPKPPLVVCETYQLKKGEGKPHKTPSLEEPSPPSTAHLKMEVLLIWSPDVRVGVVGDQQKFLSFEWSLTTFFKGLRTFIWWFTFSPCFPASHNSSWYLLFRSKMLQPRSSQDRWEICCYAIR